MIWLTLILGLALAGITVATTAVIDVTDANIDEVLKTHPKLLLEFYAPWCGHCKQLAPEYDAAAASLASHEPSVALAKIDATANSESAEKFEIEGFPTLIWFDNAVPKEYTGGRTEAEIVAWIKKRTGPACVPLSTSGELEAFKEDAEIAIVGFFGEDDTEAKAVFETHARDDDFNAYAIAIPGGEVAASAKVTSTPAVVLFKPFDEGRVDFEGVSDLSDPVALSKFVQSNALPLIVPFTPETAPKIFGGGIDDHVILFVDTMGDAETAERVISSARPVAKENRGRAMFITIERSDDRVLDFFDIDGENDASFPTVRIARLTGEDMTKFMFPDGSSVDEANIRTFVDDYFAGKIKPSHKSEAEPTEPQDDAAVHILVGTSFDAKVDAPGKHVFVEFYAPWCGHCKALMPAWEELARKFAANPDVIIAKFDATANENARVQVSGFPTLKFFPADSEEVVDFDGGRDLDSLLQFVEEQIAARQK